MMKSLDGLVYLLQCYYAWMSVLSGVGICDYGYHDMI